MSLNLDYLSFQNALHVLRKSLIPAIFFLRKRRPEGKKMLYNDWKNVPKTLFDDTKILRTVILQTGYLYWLANDRSKEMFGVFEL